jgi:hypothetical protein
MSGTKSLNSTRVESLTKEDAQDRGEVTTKRQVELLDHRGKPIHCFLCNLNHFTTNFPLKEQLEWMDENQVHPARKELTTLEEVSQPQPEPSKEMVEGLEELTKHLDEFKARDHGQCSQDGEVRTLFCGCDSEWGEGGSLG